MSRSLRRLIPSPAMLVAIVALVMSLGGSAYALVITGKSIQNNTVTGKDIRSRSLTGRDIRVNKLGGEAIKESSLGQVPSAALAGSAGGLGYWAVVNNDGVLVRGKGQAAGDPAGRTSTGHLPRDLQPRGTQLLLPGLDRQPRARACPSRTARSACPLIPTTSTPCAFAPPTARTRSPTGRST